MDIRILGPVEITGPAGPVRLGRVGERLLLAALAVDVGEPVPVRRLLDLLGADGTIAPGTLVDYAGAVRRAIVAAGGDRTMLPNARRRGAYLLKLAPDAVDFHRFLAVVGDARSRSAAGDHRGAVERYHLALGMWSGEPLANVRGGCGLRQAITDRRREAGYAMLAAQLHAGDHDEVVAAVLRAVHEEAPTDRMIEMALHALARSGRHAEIPQFLDLARQRMVIAVGTRPGAEVRRLAEALLADPQRSTTLDTASPGTAPSGGASGRPAVRCTLPVGTATFTGRAAELQAIVEAARRAAQPGGAPGIVVVGGMPGVGKTALAVHAAHQIAAWFPDRQIYLDLHAHAADRQPAEPADALAELLIADGVEPGHLPPSVDGRAALWRDRTAGTSTLLLLDDAACSDQVVPLLPGTAGNFTVVTSRRQLADLPADHLSLDTLPSGDATDMFLRLAPRAVGEVDRVRELVRVCGHLPLAVGITARLFARHRAWNVEQLLAEVRTRRLTVAAEHRSVRAALDLSYQYLSEPRRTMLRRLGLHPGEEIDAYAAAALAGVCDEQGLADLDALHEDCLIDEPSYRRYRMHDLIREYARDLASVEEAAAPAVARLLDHYAQTAALAGAHLSRSGQRPTTRPASGPELAGADQAVAWLRAERANLLAGIEVAREHGDDRRLVELTSGVGALLRLSGPWDLAAELHRAAADAAGRLGDRGGQAAALRDLGGIRLLTGDFAAAVGPLTQALAMVTAAGDAPGQANILVELADVRMVTGDYRAATELTARARDLYRAVGDRSGEALTLIGLGTQHYMIGNYPQAADLLDRAVRLFRALGNQRGQASALRQLAAVRLIHADHAAATRLLTESLQLSRALEHRSGVAVSLGRLGVARRMAGDHEGAAVLLEEALRLQRELDDRHGAAITTVQLAVLRYLDGAYPEAEGLLRRTVTDLCELGAPDDEAEARNHLGVLYRLTGRPEQARVEHELALGVATGIAYRLGRAQALEGLGRATADLGRPAKARLLLDQADQAYAELGLPDAARLPAATDALRLPG